MAVAVTEQFVSEILEDLKCSICLDVAEDPVQHEECGKLFCKECIEKYGRDKPCPNCKVVGAKFYGDRRSKKFLNECSVLPGSWFSWLVPGYW